MKSKPLFQVTEVGDFTVEIGEHLLCFATVREADKEFARLPQELQNNPFVISARANALELARQLNIEIAHGAGSGHRAFKTVFPDGQI